MFTVVPFDQASALAAVKVRRELERAGKPIGLLDALQAGQARSVKTRYTRRALLDFSEIQILSVIHSARSWPTAL